MVECEVAHVEGLPQYGGCPQKQGAYDKRTKQRLIMSGSPDHEDAGANDRIVVVIMISINVFYIMLSLFDYTSGEISKIGIGILQAIVLPGGKSSVLTNPNCKRKIRGRPHS